MCTMFPISGSPMWICTLVLVTVLDISSALRSLENIPISSEKHLIKELLRRYENVTSYGRPVTSVDNPVNVRFGLGLIQMDLDEKARALALSLWLKMIWDDVYLTWNPADFENITSVRIESKKLWIPDVMLYNTADTDTALRDTTATIHHNGTVLWVPHQKMKSSCSIDVTNFPFDTQHCHMWFGSWTYTTKYLNLTMAMPGGMDLSTYSNDFKDSNQWTIDHVAALRQVLPSSEEEPNYAVLTFTLTLRRNVVFASYILTLPCVFLACLTLVVFWLPPDRPDRTALAMSTFSSFLLLLLILVEAAPPTASSVPRLGIYYCFNMVIIMLSVFLSSLVVNVCRMGKSNSAVPSWLRKLTIDTPLKRLCDGGCGQISKDHRASSADDLEHSTAHLLGKHQTGGIPVGNSPPGVLGTEFKAIVNLLLRAEVRIAERDNQEKGKQEKRRDWRRVSVILDRIFFFCFLILIIVSIITLFPRART